MPHTTLPMIAAAKVATTPSTAKPAPMRKKPMMTDTRLLWRSATTPVGTSKRKHVASSTVPTSTSWKGSSPTTRYWKTRLRVKQVDSAKATTAVST